MGNRYIRTEDENFKEEKLTFFEESDTYSISDSSGLVRTLPDFSGHVWTRAGDAIGCKKVCPEDGKSLHQD